VDKSNEPLKDLVYANFWLPYFFYHHNELARLKKGDARGISGVEFHASEQ
jgi:hypothetical protein